MFAPSVATLLLPQMNTSMLFVADLRARGSASCLPQKIQKKNKKGRRNDKRLIQVSEEFTKIEGTAPVKCLRYGEEWRDLLGDNLIFWLCARIEELEEEINHGGYDL